MNTSRLVSPLRGLARLLLLGAALGGAVARLEAAPSPSGAPSLALRARVEPSAARYYAGQRVRLVLEAEARGAEIAQIQPLGLPAPEWAQKVDEAELKGERGVRDGETVHIWRYAYDYLLAAPGTHSFQPRLRTMLATRSQRGNGPAFIFSSSIERPAAATAEAISLDVAPPPSPAPEDFCGIVGEVRLEATADPVEASPGDLVNLRWSLVGLGDFADFRPPAVEAPADSFRAYAPKIDTPAGARDRVDVVQVFVPQTLASTNLPPLSVTVFDPVAGSYRTLCAGPFPLRIVERAEEDEDDFIPTAAGPAASPGGRQPLRRSDTTDVGAPSGASGVLPAPAIGRLAPSASSRKLRTLPAGTAVEVLERSGAWARVAAPGGASVWIPASSAGLGEEDASR